MLLHGIGSVLHCQVKFAIGRLRRTFKTISCRVVEPAMISAGDATLFYSATNQRNAPVRAAVGEQTQSTASVTKQHQVFAEHSNKFRRILGAEFFRHSDGMPIAAQ